MPAFIVGALLAGAVAGTVAAGALAFSLAAFGSALVLGGLSYVMAKDQKAPSLNSGGFDARGRNITIRQPLAPWQIVVGEIRVGGVLTYAYETDDANFHIIVSVAGHPVTDLYDFQFDDEVIPVTGYTGSPSIWDGSATGRFAGVARIQRSLGDEGATQPFPDLVTETASDWAATDLQRDRAKIYARLSNSPDLYPTGIPNVTAVCKGLKAYDPRSAQTAWTHNPALLIAAYLTDTSFGLKANYATEIDETALTAAANICEERVLLAGNTAGFTADATTNALTLNAGARIPCTGDGVRVSAQVGSPSGTLPGGLAESTTYYAIRYLNGTIRLATSYANAMAGVAIDLASAGASPLTLTYYDEPRYTANGTFRVDENPQTILNKLIAAMAGKVVKVGGKWYIHAGAYVTPTITLDEDDLAGPIRVQPLLSRRDNANGVKGAFVDPSNAWQPTDFPAVASSTYLAEDGNERVWRDIDLTATITGPARAQRLAKIELLKIRQGLTVEAPFKLGAYRAVTGGTVALTYAKFGFSAKAFDILGSTFNIGSDGSLGVTLQLRETAAAIYDWSTSEEQTVDLAPNTGLPDPWEVSAPTSLSFAQSTSLPDRGTLSWSAPSDSFVKAYQPEFKLAADSTWIRLPQTEDTTAPLDKLKPGTYDFRVKAVNTLGVSSSYATTTGIVVSALVIKEAFGVGGKTGSVQLLNTAALAGATDSIAFCPYNNRMYGVYSAGGGAFTFLPDPTSSAVTRTDILAGYNFNHVVYDPINRKMVFSQDVVGSPTQAQLVVVDPATDTVTNTFSPAGVELFRMVYCPGDGNLWCSGNSQYVYAVNPTTGALVSRVDLLSGVIRYLAWCPSNGCMYVSDVNNDRVHVIPVLGSPNYFRSGTITLTGSFPKGGPLTYCASTDEMFVLNEDATAKIDIITTATNVIATTLSFDVTVRPVDVIYVREADRIYAPVDGIDDRFYTIVPSTRQRALNRPTVFGVFNDGGRYCPVNGLLYVPLSGASTLAVLAI